MTTLKDIREHMLNYMSQDFPDDGEDYDEDGHCGNGMWNQIKGFWEDFKTDKDLLYVVSGEYMSDDIDLDGGRSYILGHSKVIPLLFDYLYNTMGYSLEKYQDITHNSLDITDEIEELYDSPGVIRDSKIDKVLDRNAEIFPFWKKGYIVMEITSLNKSEEELYEIFLKEQEINNADFFNRFAEADRKEKEEKSEKPPLVVKYPAHMKDVCDLDESLEFIGYSKIDQSPVYKVKVPGGCEVIHSIDKYL